MQLNDSTVACRSCGVLMKCLLTGPPGKPNIHATYLCPNESCATNQRSEGTRNDR